jgi:hypothetical protein
VVPREPELGPVEILEELPRREQRRGERKFW